MGARPYSKGFRNRMVARLAAPGAPTAVDLAQEVNVPQPTLSRWLREARSLGEVSKPKAPDESAPVPPSREPERDSRSTREWTATEKLRVVSAAAQLKDDDLGQLLRREGIHLAQLEEWRDDILSALGRPPVRLKNPEARRVRELERELARKDKALAEVTALLVLRKKLDALFGDSAEEGSSTDENKDKK